MNEEEIKQLIKINPKQAAHFLSEYLRQDPCSSKHYLLYGDCLLKLNEWSKAKNAYEEALKNDPDCIPACFGLAQVLQYESNFSEAVFYLKTCVAAFPHQSVFLFQLGSCYLSLKNFPAAKKYLSDLIIYFPYHREGLVNLASCLIEEKNYQEAIHHLATVHRMYPEHLPALYNLACALMEYTRFLQARDYFLLYLEKMPDDLEAHFHLGFTYLKLEEFILAQKHFQKILIQDPNHLLSLHNLANIALQQNERSVALGYYQRILQLAPHDAIAGYLASALSKSSFPPQAPKQYIKALFDQYASYFDQHLTEQLNYQTPQYLYDLWKKNQSLNSRLIRVLDLGCGTGLAGKLFKPYASKLVGVDLSKKMLEEAEKKVIYDNLYEEELIGFLKQHTETYDLILLSDVLVYFGDLNRLFSLLIEHGSQFLFSIETTEESDYFLNVHGRYQHSEAYVKKLLDDLKLHYKIKKLSLREQNQKSVPGAIFFCHV